MADASHTFFFYGTLMVPAILHRVIHGNSTPEPWQKALLTTRPALLPGYRRYRVKYADYPGILESPPSPEEPASSTSSSVLGVVVSGLSENDILRLDLFEGSSYTKRSVTVKVMKNTSVNDAVAGEGGNSNENDNVALQRGLAETAHLADGSATEMEEVQATTYVWKDRESYLELDSEWDFESFKRDKLQWWIDAPESEL